MDKYDEEIIEETRVEDLKTELEQIILAEDRRDRSNIEYTQLENITNSLECSSYNNSEIDDTIEYNESIAIDLPIQSSIDSIDIHITPESIPINQTDILFNKGFKRITPLYLKNTNYTPLYTTTTTINNDNSKHFFKTPMNIQKDPSTATKLLWWTKNDKNTKSIIVKNINK